MYSYERVVTKACKRCGQPFESRVRIEFYCDPCKPVIKKEAIARGIRKRTAKARSRKASK